MGERKRVEKDVEETLDETGRFIGKGVDRTGKLIDRGLRKVEEGAGERAPPQQPEAGKRSTVEAIVDEGGLLIGRTGKTVAGYTESGARRVGRFIDSDPDLRRAVDKGTGVVEKVVEETVKVARKGIRKAEELLDDDKKRRH